MRWAQAIFGLSHASSRPDMQGNGGTDRNSDEPFNAMDRRHATGMVAPSAYGWSGRGGALCPQIMSGEHPARQFAAAFPAATVADERFDRAEILPEAIPRILPWMILFEADTKDSRRIGFRVRLAGTALCRLAGRELRGEVIHAGCAVPFWYGPLLATLQARSSGWWLAPMLWQRPWALPVARGDFALWSRPERQVPDMIASVMAPVTPGEAVGLVTGPSGGDDRQDGKPCQHPPGRCANDPCLSG